MKIALDIGHTNNTGSRGNGIEEHATAGVIVDHLGPMLMAQGHTVGIIDYPQLNNAVDLAATVKAINTGHYDISISIHTDCSDSPTACGAHVCHNRTYHSNGSCTDSARGKALAVAIAQHLCALLPGRADHVQARPDRSCRPNKSSLYVLRETIPPAVLVECGFISNARDAAAMKTDPAAIARAIAQGIAEYATKQNKPVSF